MNDPRRPRWMVEVDIDELQDKIDEAIALRDAERVSSGPFRRRINRRIESYDQQMTLLFQELHDEGGIECQVTGCLERIDEARAFETLGYCLDHYRYATGEGPEPRPPAVEPPAIGSPW